MPGLFRRVGRLVWPHIGWRRAAAYLVHRVKRLPGSPHSIAAGFACGVAISFTPFIGFHLALSALFAWLIGGNVLASAIGTVVGNPWTFPFIWVWIHELGVWILGADVGRTTPDHFAFTEMFAQLVTSVLRFDFAGFVKYVWPVWWPMTIGGVPTAAVVWVAIYWPIRGAVAEYQLLRRHRIAKRRAANEKVAAGKISRTGASAVTGGSS